MTHSPPSSAAGSTALSREQAAMAFDRHGAPEEWRKDEARLAILSPPGLLVSASPAMLALFGAKDCEALEDRLIRGEGPSARRLRHLAATLPVGEPPRLEQMRLVVERRPIGVNLRCVRIAGPGLGSWLLLSVPALGGASDEPPAPAKPREAPPPMRAAAPDLSEKPAPHSASAPAPNSRFLWTLDEEGRFGALDPVLVAAVGANAPFRGESVEALLRRVGPDRGDELFRVLGERRTFSHVALEWPLAGIARRRLMALSAAPIFGRQREFVGYRGFGVLGEEIEAVTAPEAAEPAPLGSAGEPEAGRPSETAAGPVETHFESAPAKSAGAPQFFLETDGREPMAALTVAFEPEASPTPRQLEAAVHALENAAKTVDPNFEPPEADAPGAPSPEASHDADGLKPAPTLTEASDSDALAEAGGPDLAEGSATSEFSAFAA